jgi:hypothetical protein
MLNNWRPFIFYPVHTFTCLYITFTECRLQVRAVGDTDHTDPPPPRGTIHAGADWLTVINTGVLLDLEENGGYNWFTGMKETLSGLPSGLRCRVVWYMFTDVTSRNLCQSSWRRIPESASSEGSTHIRSLVHWFSCGVSEHVGPPKSLFGLRKKAITKLHLIGLHKTTTN